MNKKMWIRALSIVVIFLAVVSGGLIYTTNQIGNGLQESIEMIHDIKESNCLTGNNTRTECIALSHDVDTLYEETKMVEG